MTVRDISVHLDDLSGSEIGRDTISNVTTDGILADVEAWAHPATRGLLDRLLPDGTAPQFADKCAGIWPMDPAASVASLLGRYCWLVDHRQWDEWGLCFREDGVFAVRGKRLVGRAAIVQYVRDELDRFRVIRHLAHLPGITLEGEEATCRSYFELRAVTAAGAETVALGSYIDRVVDGPDGWQFAERRAEFEYWVRRDDPWYRDGAPDERQ